MAVTINILLFVNNSAMAYWEFKKKEYVSAVIHSFAAGFSACGALCCAFFDLD